MAETTIVRLARQKKELVTYVKAFLSWREALNWAHTTSRKGDAFKAVDEKRAIMDEAYKTIEPYLAE